MPLRSTEARRRLVRYIHHVVNLRRNDAQAAVEPFGWSYLLGSLVARYPATSMVDGVELATVVIDAAGTACQNRLQIDVRPDGVRLGVADGSGGVTALEVELVARIAAALGARGVHPAPSSTTSESHPVVELEVAIDTPDAERIAPFWLAALGYDQSRFINGALIDPAGRLPTVWFQAMDPVRTERNRIHLDVTVPHQEASKRIAAVLAVGGTVGPTSAPPAFTVLVDPDGNEVCISTWQGRDETS